MNVKVLLGAGAALVALFLGASWWNLPRAEPGGPSGIVAVTADPGAPGAATLAEVSGPALPRESIPEALSEPVPAPAKKSVPEDLEPPPPGALDVWVVDEEDHKIVGAKITLVQGSGMYSSWAPPTIPEGAPRKESFVPEPIGGTPGPVRFEGLDAGDWYIEVITPKGSKHSGSARLEENQGASHVVRFGSATVYGSVVDPSAGREPIPDAYLSLNGRHALTDEQGAYRFEELEAGQGELRLMPGVWNKANGNLRSLPSRFVHLHLERGESRRVDFPPALEDGGAILRGRILDAEGEVVRSPDFALREAGIWIKTRAEPDASGANARRPHSVEQRTQYGLDGTFEMHLPPGRYDVWIMSPNLSKRIHVTEVAALELPPGEVTTANFILPGITLRGQLPPGVAGPSAAQIMRGVGARQAHVTWPSGILGGMADDTGAFVLYGLEPGDWIISGGRGTCGAELTIREGDRAASVQLERK